VVGWCSARHDFRGLPALPTRRSADLAVSAPQEFERLALDGYDGILAFGEVVRQLYLRRGWARRAWTWHEAADVRLFRPIEDAAREADLVWIGNWGDDERTRSEEHTSELQSRENL